MMKNLIKALTLSAVSALFLAWGQAKGPAPKSQKELDALQAIQTATTADARLKAIDNVLTNFADTEFKQQLLIMAMQLSQSKNDPALTKTYADRLLDADPKNVFALSTLALQTSKGVREFDLDKSEKLAAAEKYAKATLDALPAAPKLRPDIPDAQWDNMKKDLGAEAHEALGTVALDRKNYDAAIQEYQTAISGAATPDPTTTVRLGEAQLKAGKVDDAIASFDKVLNAPDTPAVVKQFAQTRKIEATKLKTSGAKPADAK